MSQEEKNIPVEQQRLEKEQIEIWAAFTVPGELTPSTA